MWKELVCTYVKIGGDLTVNYEKYKLHNYCEKKIITININILNLNKHNDLFENLTYIYYAYNYYLIA